MYMKLKMHLIVAVSKVSGLLSYFHKDVGYLRDLRDAEK